MRGVFVGLEGIVSTEGVREVHHNSIQFSCSSFCDSMYARRAYYIHVFFGLVARQLNVSWDWFRIRQGIIEQADAHTSRLKGTTRMHAWAGFGRMHRFLLPTLYHTRRVCIRFSSPPLHPLYFSVFDTAFARLDLVHHWDRNASRFSSSIVHPRHMQKVYLLCLAINHETLSLPMDNII